MANYRPVNNIQGMQVNYNQYQFTWSRVGNEQDVHFLWIYKEDELNMPQVMKYGQCIDNRVQVTFQNANLSLTEIQKVRFLIFLSDSQYAPPGYDLAAMINQPGYLCEVYCGIGSIQWEWQRGKVGASLRIISDRKIPEGICYFEYWYGNQMLQFELPGEIYPGETLFSNIIFPELAAEPQLGTRVRNISLERIKKNNVQKPINHTGNTNSGMIDKIKNIFRG